MLQVALLSVLGLSVTVFVRIESSNTKFLGMSLRGCKDPHDLRMILEELQMLFRRYQANDGEARLALMGYIEELQRGFELDEGSPLVFERLWDEDMSFMEYVRKEGKAFISFLSFEYLKAVKR